MTTQSPECLLGTRETREKRRAGPILLYPGERKSTPRRKGWVRKQTTTMHGCPNHGA